MDVVVAITEFKNRLKSQGYAPSTIEGYSKGLDQFKRYMAGRNITDLKNVTTHTFRHTCATHMLKNGAPVRHLQEMLGHECLESTQIYTHVTINDLKEIHARYHPGESMQDKPDK